jgi:hypothetical protein
MKRTALLLALFVAAAGCSSSSAPKIAMPELQLTELASPSDMHSPGGEVEVKYGLRIRNPSAEAITLLRVDMSSTGPGAYALIRDPKYANHNYNVTVQPGQFEDVTIWARAFHRGPLGVGSNDPVTVRAVAFFDSPAGKFQKIVTKYLPQLDGTRR